MPPVWKVSLRVAPPAYQGPAEGQLHTWDLPKAAGKPRSYLETRPRPGMRRPPAAGASVNASVENVFLPSPFFPGLINSF